MVIRFTANGESNLGFRAVYSFYLNGPTRTELPATDGKRIVLCYLRAVFETFSLRLWRTSRQLGGRYNHDGNIRRKII